MCPKSSSERPITFELLGILKLNVLSKNRRRPIMTNSLMMSKSRLDFFFVKSLFSVHSFKFNQGIL